MSYHKQSLSEAVSEQVYIAQLHRRALILDRRFKDKVIDALNVGSPEIDAKQNVGQDSSSISETAGNTASLGNSVSSGIPVVFKLTGQVTRAEVFLAPVKTQHRMREKLARYEPPYPGSQWPLTGHITDPVRLSVVCSGPSDVLQVSSRRPCASRSSRCCSSSRGTVCVTALHHLLHAPTSGTCELTHRERHDIVLQNLMCVGAQTVRLFVETQSQTGLRVCRVKNKFLLPDVEVEDGYRDVTLNVLFEAENLRIIGEIQVDIDFKASALFIK